MLGLAWVTFCNTFAIYICDAPIMHDVRLSNVFLFYLIPQAKDIADLGSLKEAARIFVPGKI